MNCSNYTVLCVRVRYLVYMMYGAQVSLYVCALLLLFLPSERGTFHPDEISGSAAHSLLPVPSLVFLALLFL